MSSGWHGVISSAYQKLKLRCINSYGFCFPEYIGNLILDLRKADMDQSCLVVGDNGSGKSVAAAIIFKCVNPNMPFGPEHVVYAEDKTSDFMTKMEALHDDVLVIDELNKFMSHRNFMDKSQNKLIQFIEIARAKRVATISCVNAYSKVDKSFREGKVSVVIQMLDRKNNDLGLGQSCGAVFAAPPIMLSSSRFGLDILADVHSDQEFLNLSPWVPSFCGFIFFPDKKEYLSDEEWNNYTDAKMRGIRKSFEQAKTMTLNQEERELKDLEENEMSEEEEIEHATEEAEKKERMKQAVREKMEAKRPKPAKPLLIIHSCGCETQRDTKGLIHFLKKCAKHELRPEFHARIKLNHMAQEKAEKEERDGNNI